MSYKFAALIFLFFALSNIVNCQSEIHEIKLIKSSSPLNTAFRCDTIIDKRLVKTNIGFVQKGLSNRKVTAILLGSFDNLIKQQINESIIISQKDARGLVFIIHELNVSEITTFYSEKGVCKVEIEFAYLRDGKYFTLGSFYSEVERGGLDVTKRHNERINMALTQCIIAFINSDALSEPEEEIDISRPRDLSYDFSQIPKRGYYTSFRDLAKNKILENFHPKFIQLNSTKIIRYRLRTPDKWHKSKKVAFVSDGKSIYIHSSSYCHLNYYLKAIHHGKYIYFEDRYSDPNATIAFGLAGAALSNSKKSIVLDTTNGNIQIMDDKEMYILLENHQSILERFMKSERKIGDIEKAIIMLNTKFK